MYNLNAMNEYFLLKNISREVGDFIYGNKTQNDHLSLEITNCWTA